MSSIFGDDVTLQPPEQNEEDQRRQEREIERRRKREQRREEELEAEQSDRVRALRARRRGRQLLIGSGGETGQIPGRKETLG